MRGENQTIRVEYEDEFEDEDDFRNDWRETRGPSLQSSSNSSSSSSSIFDRRNQKRFVTREYRIRWNPTRCVSHLPSRGRITRSGSIIGVAPVISRSKATRRRLSKAEESTQKATKIAKVGDESHVTEKSIWNKLFEVFEIFCANSPGSPARFRIRVRSAPPISTIFERVEKVKSLRGLYKVLAVTCAAGILTGCTTLVTGFNRIHDMMTKEETPEETHYYGAFFTSPLPMTSELPTEWPRHKKSAHKKPNLPQTQTADPEDP